MADTFTGAPGFLGPMHEADFVPRKKQVDVLLLGSAYAPGGRPATTVPVGLRVNGITKTFAVVGDRQWDAGISGLGISPAQPFTKMPISYDRAFGGVDDRNEDPAKHAAFMRNPVGRGFRKHSSNELLTGTPLPNTQELNRAVSSPDADYAPMSFGPIGRGWEPRYRYAGTYDDEWLEKHFPFLPPDFDEQYYQSAPLDQRFAGPLGGHEVTLVNLTPDGRRELQDPGVRGAGRGVPEEGRARGSHRDARHARARARRGAAHDDVAS